MTTYSDYPSPVRMCNAQLLRLRRKKRLFIDFTLSRQTIRLRLGGFVYDSYISFFSIAICFLGNMLHQPYAMRRHSHAHPYAFTYNESPHAHIPNNERNWRPERQRVSTSAFNSPPPRLNARIHHSVLTTPTTP